MNRKKRLKNIILECMVVFLSTVILIPSIMVMLASFKDKAGASVMNLKLPKQWFFLENYSTVIKVGNILSGYINSTVNTILVVILSLLITSLAAFIIQRRDDRIARFFHSFFLLGMVVPTNIILLVLMVKRLELDNIAGLVLVQTTRRISFATLLLIGYLKGIPREIDESAFIDGGRPFRIFYSIILPLLKPIFYTLVIIISMQIWNDFLMPLYILGDPKSYTVGLSLFYFVGEHTADWNLVFAAIIVISFPVLVLYLFLQRYIISGLTYGALKG